jgi:crotonobetainyl-CoA:carnitine CoA-transferase CaiB-like acyl-CoA transferase
MTGPALAGLRVVDLSSTFMGPYCTLLLAQWGADVIKVEPPTGDVVRHIGDRRRTGMGPVFLNTNRGKRSLVLDLKDDSGRTALNRLIDSCDVLVHTMRPQAATRAGLTAEAVLARNPRCVLLAFRGFGAGGPAENDPAYDDVIQARSGLAALQGGGCGEPAYVRSAIADKIVGVYGAAALLATLHERDSTGRGRAIEIPMLETVVSFTLLEQQGGLVFDPPAGPSGYARTSSPYRRPYRTKDGSIAVMIYTDAQWATFFHLVGRPEAAEDPRFRTITERTLHIDELYGMVEAAMGERTSAEWLHELASSGIPVSPVNSIDDLFSDPHLRATGFFRRVSHPSEGDLVLPTMPGPTGDAPPDASWHAPLLGADTAEVLAGLDIDGGYRG